MQAMAPRLADLVGSDSLTVIQTLRDTTRYQAWDLPGPSLEGFLFPDTYRFAEGVTLDNVISTMVSEYRAYWTPERRQRLAESGLSELEAVTLASIIQAEARQVDEMPTISSVYHNRLEIGMLLQADPTVIYALGGPRSRLLFAAIDSVADNPYNTYTQAGLPPGPICQPGEAALDAALSPAETDFMYFVARNDGSHAFTRTLRDHNRAIREIRGTRRSSS